ncbi:MAG: PspA/IM30 family protein [Chloroflexota bacterium]
MPEELFDLLEELVEGADNRKRRRRRRNVRQDEPWERRRDVAMEPPPPSAEGIKGRIGHLIRPSKPAEPAEPATPPDPRTRLEESYRQQRALLEEMSRSVDQVTSARLRLERQAAENSRRIAEFEERARDYLQAGHEDLARNALERRRLALVQEDEFQRQIEELAREQSELMQAEARLEAKVETLQSQLTVLAFRISAAEAQARAKEATGGLSNEFVDVVEAIDRVERHAAGLRGRGEAIDQLIESGELRGDENRHLRFEREMGLSEVDDDLERLKRELEDPTNR